MIASVLCYSDLFPFQRHGKIMQFFIDTTSAPIVLGRANAERTTR